MSALPPEGVNRSTLLICFSHLRWDFVVQRPQHLMRRAARSYRVVYVEELVRHDGYDEVRVRVDHTGVTVVTPYLNHGTQDTDAVLRDFLSRFVASSNHQMLVTWYYTPMAVTFSDHLLPDVCIYDCMDELSAFRFAPETLGRNEDRLFSLAHYVFTGGRSLFEAKSHRHPRVLCLPSSIDSAHFARARTELPDPADQAAIAHPRVGFFGVIDERLDLALVRQTAAALPDVQFVMVGPVVKIDPASLPQAANIHWLGGRHYDDLPAYLANWDAGWMPFALNDSTRYISPTKTPEFLAAGLPLSSTAVPDVVADYGRPGFVAIGTAATMPEVVSQTLSPRSPDRIARIDAHLAGQSWDRTWATMRHSIERIPHERQAVRQINGQINGVMHDA
jgi:hypothetical protein